jgi:hypothetical protein
MSQAVDFLLGLAGLLLLYVTALLFGEKYQQATVPLLVGMAARTD